MALQPTSKMESNRTTGANEPHSESSIDTDALRYTQHTDQIATNDLYQALANQRRRQVIRALDDGPREMGPIARAIAAAENETTVEAVTGTQRKRVYVSLYQTHLDKLDSWDIVEWDGTGHAVAPGPAHEAALEAIEAVAGDGSETEPEPEPTTWRDRLAGILPGGVA